MKITIVGLGLIGASIARALQGKAYLTGIDTNTDSIKKGLKDGIIVEGGHSLSLAATSDLVVIALPVGEIVETALGLIDHLKRGTVITDTGSTKSHIVSRVTASWPWFVGSHPIAGSEFSGYDAARADLFRSGVSVITPSASTEGYCIEVVKRLWQMCGAQTFEMSPEKHDAVMASISHLPHLLSFVFMHLARDLNNVSNLFGKAFTDFTRIAGSDPVIWRDIFMDNKQHIMPRIEQYLQALKHIQSLIADNREQELEELLRVYMKTRRSLYEYPG